MTFNINHLNTVIGTFEVETVLGMEYVKEVHWNDDAPQWLLFVDAVDWVRSRLFKYMPVSDAISITHCVSETDGFWFGNPCDLTDARENAAHSDFVPDLSFYELIDSVYSFMGVLSVVEIHGDALRICLKNTGLGWQSLSFWRDQITIDRLKNHKCYDDLCRIIVADALVCNTARTLDNIGFLYRLSNMEVCGLAILAPIEDDADIIRTFDTSVRNEDGGNMFEVAYQCAGPEIKKKLRQLKTMDIDADDTEMVEIIKSRASFILEKDNE